MRFSAPIDVSGINLALGPLSVVDGFVDVPDDAGPGDLAGLAANGFTPAPENPAPTPPRATATRTLAGTATDKPDAAA